MSCGSRIRPRTCFEVSSGQPRMLGYYLANTNQRIGIGGRPCIQSLQRC